MAVTDEMEVIDVATSDKSELLTMAEARAVLRVSTATLYVQVLPTLPTVQLGARRFVRRAALDAWLVAREAPGTDPGPAERVRESGAGTAVETGPRLRSVRS